MPAPPAAARCTSTPTSASVASSSSGTRRRWRRCRSSAGTGRRDLSALLTCVAGGGPRARRHRRVDPRGRRHVRRAVPGAARRPGADPADKRPGEAALVSDAMATATGGMPQLAREGRVLAGVCAGIARHFDVSVRFVRVAFVVLTLAGGIGVALYGLAYVSMRTTADQSISFDPAEVLREAGLSWREGIGTGLVAAALVVALGGDWRGAPAAGAGGGPPPVRWGGGAGGAGRPVGGGAGPAMMLWRSGLGRSQRGRVGAGLMVVGAVLVASAVPKLGDLQSFGFAVIVVLAGSVLLFGPWWLRMAQALTAERTARIRAQERAEVAAHLHDSVLQTLALIQRRADDPTEVAQLARRQERDLRAWLNAVDIAAAETLHGALVRAAAEIEERHGVEVELVCVGDRPLDGDTAALASAAREAILNAAKFAGAGRIDVYAEASDERAEVFVRDRGGGFDPEAVPADRRGVRESIVGRMERHGGRAEVRSQPGGGTEVELLLP